jgi:hypothetical protein
MTGYSDVSEKSSNFRIADDLAGTDVTSTKISPALRAPATNRVIPPTRTVLAYLGMLFRSSDHELWKSDSVSGTSTPVLVRTMVHKSSFSLPWDCNKETKEGICSNYFV